MEEEKKLIKMCEKKELTDCIIRNEAAECLGVVVINVKGRRLALKEAS